ncbi:MAG: 4-alpha-glucanotransferase [Candidatus Margulisiibacteriota bacterium]
MVNYISPVREKHFMPTFSIAQLRSSKVQDLGAGNMRTFKATVDQLAAAGIKHVCLQPIHEVAVDIASLFSRTSMNALSHRLLDLSEIPEVKELLALRKSVADTLARANRVTQGSTTNLGLVEVEYPAVLEKAFERFSLSNHSQRTRQFNFFCEEHSWWLDKYAYFKGLKERFGHLPMEQWDRAYADLSSSKAQEFMGVNKDRINYHKYVQMETYRQVREGLDYARTKGIEEIEVLVGVGTSRESAEGFLMPDMFDFARQIGCFPEPENGYPIQLWGFLAEKDNDALLEFKVKSFQNLNELGINRIGIDHACGFLGGYTTFPVYDPQLLAQGQYRVLNAADPRDAKIAEEGGRWVFKPETEEAERKAFAQKVLFALLEKVPDMKFTAETVGDFHRRVAAEEAIQAAVARGRDITLMRSLPWEDVPLAAYGPNDRLSLTHDMPALTGLLTAQAGDHNYGWIDGQRAGKFLNRFGILAPGLTKPLSVSELTTKFMMEVHRRIIAGSGAETVVMPLASLYTLSPDHLNAGRWQYTNIQPGTSGEIGNPMGNWEQRLPVIEGLDLVNIRESTGTDFRPFGSVGILSYPDDLFQAQVKDVVAEAVAYRAAAGKWTVWQPTESQRPLMEIAVTYTGTTGSDEKAWARFNVADLGFDSGSNYVFYDLVSGKGYKKTGQELLNNGLHVGLQAETPDRPGSNRHHFVVFKEELV